MWFKNLQLLRFIQPFTMTEAELEVRLDAYRFRPCGALEPISVGWSPPLGRKGSQLVHTTNGYLMIAAAKEEKILPAAVINELVGERVEELENEQMRPVGKKERDELRSEILLDLLPRAFSRTLRTYAYIAPREGWLIVDAASRKKAEELTVLLRKALGSLPITFPTSVERPTTVMTRWLTEHQCPADFVVESECELRSPEDEGGVVRCRRQDLATPEIQAHLEAGKEVIQLALSWNERMSFLLDEAFSLKRLRFLDMVQDQAAEVETDDEATRFDTDFSIMTLELAAFIPRLFEVFGGENREALTHAATKMAGLEPELAAGND